MNNTEDLWFYECIDNTTKETVFVSEVELNTYPDRYTRIKFKYEKPVPIVVNKANGTQTQSTVNPLGLTPEQLQRRMDELYKQGYRENVQRPNDQRHIW